MVDCLGQYLCGWKTFGELLVCAISLAEETNKWHNYSQIIFHKTNNKYKIVSR